MVATQAFGLAVVSDAPTPSPISRDGHPVLWRQTRTLTLEDGSTAWGCAHCDYVSRNMRSIRPHLGRHNKTRAPRTNGHTPAADLTVHELLGQLGALEELRAELDTWRARALKAEKALRTLRSVLGGDR